MRLNGFLFNTLVTAAMKPVSLHLRGSDTQADVSLGADWRLIAVDNLLGESL
ncbi:MAG: hypothetical protein R2744_07580 [Bacteroidales bacterium]